LSWFGTRGGRKQDTERIAAIEKRLEGLDSGFKTIRVEWEDVYDRLMKVMGRLNARIRKSEAGTAPESDDHVDGQAPAPPAGLVALTGSHSLLAAARANRRGR